MVVAILFELILITVTVTRRLFFVWSRGRFLLDDGAVETTSRRRIFLELTRESVFKPNFDRVGDLSFVQEPRIPESLVDIESPVIESEVVPFRIAQHRNLWNLFDVEPPLKNVIDGLLYASSTATKVWSTIEAHTIRIDEIQPSNSPNLGVSITH
jgi:hypothetical protein